ncbi:unnamed protein product [Gadus morhua 'NCC']
MIAEALEFKGQIHHYTSLSDGQLKKTANNAKLRRYLPDFPFTPLREGTKLTCDCVFSQLEHYVDGSSRDLIQRLSTQVEVRTQFISKEEECALFQELEPGLKRKRYQFDHWDDAIHGYRETERGTWGSVCEGVLRRVKSVAFPEGSPLLGPVHVLDLDKAGFIKPHIDSIKFCGSTIAGLNLLSDSVMRLVKEDDAHQWLDLFLPRYSLYILRDTARYGFTHEILKDEQSVFRGSRVPRERRISVICRNLPMEKQETCR